MTKKKLWLGAFTLLTLLASIAFAQSSEKSINNSEIKNEKAVQKAVLDYFDWQYASFKDGVNKSIGLKPSVSSEEAQGFLRKKQDYLEVLDVNSEVNGIIITDQNFTLVFSDMSFTGDDLVSVKVMENYERRYEYAEEPATGSVIHQINLRRNGRKWEIVGDVVEGGDAPPADIDKFKLIEEIRQEAAVKKQAEQDFLQGAGISQEFLAGQADEVARQGLDQKQTEGKLKEIVNQKINDYWSKKNSSQGPVLELSTNRGYNRQAAQSYMRAWGCRGCRNSAWGNFSNLGGDCTNFVSQIIYAGGIPKDYSGSYQWYYDSMTRRASSWTGVTEFWNYLVGNSNGNGYNGPQASFWYDSSGPIQMQPGDVIQLYNGSRWFHTYAVYRTEWVKQCPSYNPFCSNWVVKVYIASHDFDRLNEDIDVVSASYRTRRYARIVGWRAP